MSFFPEDIKITRDVVGEVGCFGLFVFGEVAQHIGRNAVFMAGMVDAKAQAPIVFTTMRIDAT